MLKSCLTLAIPWTCQAPVSMGFSRKEYCSGLPWAFSHCRVGAPSHCGTWAAPLCSFSCCGAWALKRRLRSCAGAQAQLLCGTWDPPRPGTDPVSPALVGGLPSIVQPGSSPIHKFYGILRITRIDCTYFLPISSKMVTLSAMLSNTMPRLWEECDIEMHLVGT